VANNAPFHRVAKRPRIRTGGAEEEIAASFVTGDFFATFDIPLLRGRAFREFEQYSATHVVIVSDSLARRLWPGQDATGKTLAISESAWSSRERPAPAEAFRECEVIGVARDIEVELDKDDRRLLYLPFAMEVAANAPVFMRPRSHSSAALTAIVRAAEAGGVGLEFGPSLAQQREQQITPFVMLASFSGALGLLALVLASVGLYGVMTFVVSQRVREIGIRMALGATTRMVVRLFLRQGMRLVAIGVVFGLIGGRLFALALSKISDQGLNAFDATTFAGVALLFSLIALISCWLPARRATKVDPMLALRAE
jgi:hypothetical protein